MTKKAIILLADGFEEVEAITPMDYLRRAGVELTTVSIGPDEIVGGSHGIRVIADITLEALAAQGFAAGRATDWDAVVLPGGMPGAANLAASPGVGSLVTALAAAGKLICAICAAPAVVLAPLGLLRGRRFTCYPGMEELVQGARRSPDPVVIDGNIITSQGAGNAGHFAVAIIGELLDEGTAKNLAGKVLL
jgi:4-methyl-5(b-hydroxyethyl)-thiazole monophosphate biosynthesis